jgi:magnesium-protoporphyrin IX monomethyl ester (oxidative) cyclase
MKITLIALPWIFPHSALQQHEGFSQNLGIGYIGAYAEQHGHSVCIIDAFAAGAHVRTELTPERTTYYVHGLTPEETARRVPDDTDVIGLSCPFTSQAHLIERFAAPIKRRYPHKRILLGGTYATTFPREALSEHVDVVVRGEGELPVVEILSAAPLSTVRGILYRDGGDVRDNGLAPVVEDLDSLPFPARHLLPMETYFERSPRGVTKRRSLSITTSRGCPFSCNFCSLHNLENQYARRWRARSPANVMAEIDHLLNLYGDIALQFEDDNILVDTRRAKELFSLLRRRRVRWAIHSGVMVNQLDEELVGLMKESGCERLNLALESGNEPVLRAMNKKVDLRRAENVVKWCARYKIDMVAFLMVGYPGETGNTFQETLHFLKSLRSLGLTRIAPFIVNPHMGTPLYEDCRRKGYLRNVEDLPFSSDVCIETEDFTSRDVREWVLAATEVMHPYRSRATRVLTRILPRKNFDGVRTVYRGLRSLLADLGLGT